jgi:hypothetical protein
MAISLVLWDLRILGLDKLFAAVLEMIENKLFLAIVLMRRFG